MKRAAETDPELGAVVSGWLVKLVLTLGVLGLVGLDGAAVAQAQFGASDDADTAANAAADTYKSTHSPNAAITAARATFTHTGEIVQPHSFVISPAGDVSLKVERTAKTLWMQKVPGLKDHLVAIAAGSGAPPS